MSNEQFYRKFSTISRRVKTIHYCGRGDTVVKLERNLTLSLAPHRECPVEADGFAWGSEQAGALLLAFSLLREVAPRKRAIAAYKAFCREVIVLLRPTWAIARKDIKYWLAQWEKEEVYLKSLKSAAPKSSAPRQVPFYGVMDETLGSLALSRVKELVAIAGDRQESAGALMYLELAVNLLTVRRKTVDSIYWQNAPAKARAEVWIQLLLMERQIAFNLMRFGEHWDAYMDGIAPDLCFPEPDYLTPEISDLINHQGRKKADLQGSIRDLVQIAERFQERQTQYAPFLQKQLTNG